MALGIVAVERDRVPAPLRIEPPAEKRDSVAVHVVGTGTVAMPNFVLTRRAAVESSEARGSGTLLAFGRPERVPFTERGHGAFTAMARTVPLFESVIVMIDLPGAGAQGRGGGLKSSWVLARSRTRRRSREKSRLHHTGRDGRGATLAEQVPQHAR